MKKLYKVNTNAGTEMICLDHDNKQGWIYRGTDGWQYDHSLNDVTDVSGWDRGCDDLAQQYIDLLNMIENDSDIEIIEERESVDGMDF